MHPDAIIYELVINRGVQPEKIAQVLRVTTAEIMDRVKNYKDSIYCITCPYCKMSIPTCNKT